MFILLLFSLQEILKDSTVADACTPQHLGLLLIYHLQVKTIKFFFYTIHAVPINLSMLHLRVGAIHQMRQLAICNLGNLATGEPQTCRAVLTVEKLILTISCP